MNKFGLRFKIVSDIDSLKNISAREFDNRYRHLYGMIELLFGDHSIGYCYDNEVDNEAFSDFFQDTSLTTWFETLLNAQKLIRDNELIYIHIHDSLNTFLMLHRKDMLLQVSCLEINYSDKTKNNAVSFPAIMVGKIAFTMHKNNIKKTKQNISISLTDSVINKKWGPIRLSLPQFNDEILKNIELFLSYLQTYLPKIYLSNTIENIKLLSESLGH